MLAKSTSLKSDSVDILTQIALLISERDQLAAENEILRQLFVSTGANGYDHMIPISEAVNKLGCSKPHIYNESKKLTGLLHTERGKTYVNLKVWFDESDTHSDTQDTKNPSQIAKRGKRVVRRGLYSIDQNILLLHQNSLIGNNMQPSNGAIDDHLRYLVSPIVSPKCLNYLSSSGIEKIESHHFKYLSTTIITTKGDGSVLESPACQMRSWSQTRMPLLAEKYQDTLHLTDRSETRRKKL